MATTLTRPRGGAAARFAARLAAAAAVALGLGAGSADAREFVDARGAPLAMPELIENMTLVGYDAVAGELPPIADRLPLAPLIVDPTELGREFGVHGGVWRMLINKAKRVSYGVVYGYARLVGYGPDLRLQPDILLDVEVTEGRRFVLRLRPGHRWSDGAPFTSEDFRYWWEDVANHPDLSPNGPPAELLVDGAPPTVTFPDATTVIYEWSGPNPQFLRSLAGARPLYIYRPAHYMTQFHANYADADVLAAAVEAAGARSWASLHNSSDNLYKSDNVDLPVLQPWRLAEEFEGRRFVWERNPYFHRIDSRGRQLPYIDSIEMVVAAGGLIAAKAAAGEVDLQAHAIAFPDAPVLRQDEDRGDYRMVLWRSGLASQLAIYPNLNHDDPVWREVMRDVRFRRALSLGIDRDLVNRVLYFEFGLPVGNGLLPDSPLYQEGLAEAWATFDLAAANALLDDMGLTERDADGLRLLPDGRPMKIYLEIADAPAEASDGLEIVRQNWAELGVELLIRQRDRDSLRNRVYSGEAMMSAWYGWENGLASPTDPPHHLAPRYQEDFQWPFWGQHHQTSGEAGEAPDMPAATRLLELADAWDHATDDAEREAIWREMLVIHSEEVFLIGVVSGAPQPVVISDRMRNVPEDGFWSWDPGAHFGVHRSDLFYFAPQ